MLEVIADQICLDCLVVITALNTKSEWVNQRVKHGLKIVREVFVNSKALKRLEKHNKAVSLLLLKLIRPI